MGCSSCTVCKLEMWGNDIEAGDEFICDRCARVKREKKKYKSLSKKKQVEMPFVIDKLCQMVESLQYEIKECKELIQECCEMVAEVEHVVVPQQQKPEKKELSDEDIDGLAAQELLREQEVEDATKHMLWEIRSSYNK